MQTFRFALTGDLCDHRGRSERGDLGLAALEGAPFIERHALGQQAPGPDLEVTPEQIATLHGLLVLGPWVKRGTFAGGAKNLVVIGRWGAGYDKIDLAACTENDVALFTAPQALRHPTASSALLFMLALAKRLTEQERVARAGRWDRLSGVIGTEIQGRTLGIIGLGHSGRELTRLVAPFAMRVLAYSPHADPAQARELGVRLAPLDEVLRESDFVSLHARLGPATRHLIGAPQLALMKPGAYLINVARGGLVDQDALVAALRERRIAGAGLDVFEVEPLPAGDPLTRLENVILTPHLAPSTADAWLATGGAMAAGLLKAARGQVPDHVVNTEVLRRPGFHAKLERFAANETKGILDA